MGDGPEHELLSKAGGRADGKKTKKKDLQQVVALQPLHRDPIERDATMTERAAGTKGHGPEKRGAGAKRRQAPIWGVIFIQPKCTSMSFPGKTETPMNWVHTECNVPSQMSLRQVRGGFGAERIKF